MTCHALGALLVGGREVAAFRCELEEGHHARFHRTPHAYLVTWNDRGVDIPDAALFDPEEAFDNVVPFPT